MTFAMDWEFKAWRKLRGFRRLAHDPRIYEARIGETRVSVLLTGMGPRNASRAAHTIATEYAPDFCIISGLAGGLKERHRPGEILAARTVCSETRAESIQPEDKLFALATELGAKPVDRFVSVSRVARTSEEKFALGTFADAVDMESFTLMTAIERSGVPAVAIRGVADPAELTMPYDFERMLHDSGRIRVGNLATQIAQSPKGLWPLARFGLASLRAAASLGRYLDGYVTRAGGMQQSLNLTLEQVAQP